LSEALARTALTYSLAAAALIAGLAVVGAYRPETYAAAASLAYVLVSLAFKPPLPRAAANAISLASAAILLVSLALRVLA